MKRAKAYINLLKIKEDLIRQGLLLSYEEHTLVHPNSGEIIHECATIEYVNKDNIGSCIFINNLYDTREIKWHLKRYEQWKKQGFPGTYYNH